MRFHKSIMKLSVLLLYQLHIYDDPKWRNVGQSPVFQIPQAHRNPLLHQSPDGGLKCNILWLHTNALWQDGFLSVIIFSVLSGNVSLTAVLLRVRPDLGKHKRHFPQKNKLWCWRKLSPRTRWAPRTPQYAASLTFFLAHLLKMWTTWKLGKGTGTAAYGRPIKQLIIGSIFTYVWIPGIDDHRETCKFT